MKIVDDELQGTSTSYDMHVTVGNKVVRRLGEEGRQAGVSTLDVGLKVAHQDQPLRSAMSRLNRRAERHSRHIIGRTKI
jgi:hypothetical protein